MNPTTTTLILVGTVLAICCVALWMYLQKRRTHQLQAKFGPEYDRAVSEHRTRRLAESELERRTARVAKFEIHPLNPDDRAWYAQQWRVDQSHFVDDPRAAVKQADTLVQDVMRRRGYPMGEFEECAAHLSVDHPRVIENYRIAHEIALRDSQGTVDTEDFRKAMVSYRALFEELLGSPVEKHEEVRK